MIIIPIRIQSFIVVRARRISSTKMILATAIPKINSLRIIYLRNTKKSSIWGLILLRTTIGSRFLRWERALLARCSKPYL